MIDYKDLIERAAKAVIDSLPTREHLPHRTRPIYFYRRFHNGDITPMKFGEIQADLIALAWKGAVSMMENSHVVKDPLSAERLLLSLKRRDVVREKIGYDSGHFDVKLDNWRYRLYKKEDGVRVLPYTCFGNNSDPFCCDPEELAAFMTDFDKHIPEINIKAEEVHKVHMDEILQMQKDKKAAEIRESAVKSLINQFLKPLGINMTFHFNSDGSKVSAHLHKEITLDLEVPFEQLAATLKDTEGIIARMK